ncbi:hypothetical protein PINS_up007673 [Pythium insidiosum]|nr:hypothetical protein PINS_up007673 [Pythium insidiosum]
MRQLLVTTHRSKSKPCWLSRTRLRLDSRHCDTSSKSATTRGSFRRIAPCCAPSRHNRRNSRNYKHSSLSSRCKRRFIRSRSFIQLGADPAQRLATLRSLREDALHSAFTFVQQRLGPVDERQPFRTEDRFIDATGDGDFHLLCCDILHFPTAKSVKQAFDSLSFYLSNMEISISETLSDLAILEDMDTVDTNITNRRILSATQQGIMLELNTVLFTEFVDGDAPYAVIAAQSVDDDVLHPYRPADRMRKDVSVAITISSFRRRRSENPFLSNSQRLRLEQDNDEDDSELVVVMKRCGLVTLRRPQFDVAPEVLEEMFNGLHSWGQVMVTSMRDNLRAANAA